MPVVGDAIEGANVEGAVMTEGVAWGVVAAIQVGLGTGREADGTTCFPAEEMVQGFSARILQTLVVDCWFLAKFSKL